MNINLKSFNNILLLIVYIVGCSDDSSNHEPVANAGPDQNVSTGSMVTLDGSGSTDEDDDQLTFSWSLTSTPAGSDASLTGADEVNPTFTPEIEGDYLLNLVVNDGKVDSEADPVTISAAVETVSGLTGVAVDPYIVDITFCEDANGNGSCDATEQTSTASDASGQFYFDDPLTLGSAIIVDVQGIHNGVPYELNITRIVDSTGGLVVSPLTSLSARDLSPAQIVEMLQTAGLTDITADHILTDPMEGIKDMSGSLTEAQLVKIRASLAVYTFLRISEGSDALKALTGTEMYFSAMNNGEVYQILSAMVTIINTALSPAILTTVQAVINNASVTMPDVTAEDVTQAAVAIADYLSKIGYEKCNETGGDVSAALGAVAAAANNGINVAAWAQQLGQNFYAANNKSSISQYYDYFPDALKQGLDCASGTFVINAAGNAACY